MESKEYLAGFWIIEAADLDVALELAAEGSKNCNRKVEVRPFRMAGGRSGAWRPILRRRLRQQSTPQRDHEA